MNCQAFFAYFILVVFSYFYDVFGSQPNKITYDKQHLDYSLFSAISNLFWGAIIYFLCNRNYNTLAWVLTAITFMSVASVITLNLLKVKVVVTDDTAIVSVPPTTKQ